MNPVAVLLIVGGATIGPIEARDKPLLSEPRAECMAVHGIHGQVHWFEGGQQISARADYYCRRAGLETVSETCERAMKEIGAREGATFMPALKMYRPNGQWELRGQPVLCVPAPTGLKR